jgi:hypothetical protein
MNQVNLYRWRTLWQGKWITTRYLATEAKIKVAHTEAQRSEGSGEVRMVAETDHEVSAASTSAFLGVGGDCDGRFGLEADSQISRQRPFNIPVRLQAWTMT